MALSAVAERGVHEALWLAGSVSIRRGRPRSLPAASERYVTTVVRVPAEVGAALDPVLDRLRRLDPGHHYYAPDTLHVTVANLDRLRAPLDRVQTAIASAPRLELAVGGLGLSPGTVLARVHPVDASFLRLRRELRALVDRPRGLRARLVRPLLGRIAFANVVRFSGSVSRPFLDEVAGLRRLDLGRWTATEIELVETDRLLSPERTRVLARVALGNGA